MNPLMPELAESPCIGVCTLDDRGWCIGCFRTADEIRQWSELEPAERRSIIAALPDRAAE